MDELRALEAALQKHTDRPGVGWAGLGWAGLSIILYYYCCSYYYYYSIVVGMAWYATPRHAMP